MNGKSDNDNYKNDLDIIEEFVSMDEAYEPEPEPESKPGPRPELESEPEPRPLPPSHSAQPQENNTRPAGKSIQITDGAKPKSGKLAAGLLGGLIGLLIGGVGVYTILMIINSQNNNANCVADEPIATPNTSSEDEAFDFLKLETAEQNLIYSPLSIRSGLSLLSAGAAGTTAAEIDAVLGDTTLPKYENIPDELSFANAIFIRNDFSEYVLPSYISAVTDNNNADIIFDDFSSSLTIDNWASQKTFGLINTLGITPNESTELVLANALAIQMDWAHPFDSYSVYDDTFYLADGTEASVSTLHDTFSNDDITYYQGDNVTALTLPLSSVSEANLEFTAIMPASDLGAYVEGFTADKLTAILDESVSASTPAAGVAVTIPKFKFDYQLKFKEDLQSLGIVSAFEKDSADFSNLASLPLYVGDAIHKANIEFTETGIKAAAVTAFGMELSALPVEETSEPVYITIDQPFLFVIRDRDNGAIWFTGTVYNPAA